MKSDSKHLLVRKLSHGMGVFAARPFRKGETICIMTGKALPKGKILFRHRQDRLIHIEQAYTDPMQIGPATFMMLDAPYLYFNHSCDPNAGVRNRTTIFALRAITKGEEISYDYSTTMDELITCRCGSKKCRGAAADFFALPHATQKRYIRLGAVPTFIQKKYRRLHPN